MLSKLIMILHLLLVIIIAVSPYIDNFTIKNYSLIFLIYLLLQYLTGYQKCGLTQLEYMVKQEDYKEGFLYRLITPLITVREDYFTNYLLVVHLIYILILGYQLYY
jgi:hypothetical protein